MLRAVLLIILALPLPALADAGAEERLVRSVLNQLQPPSFAANREYCGFIGYDSRGRLKAGRARRGNRDECTPELPQDLEIVASYHTHGGFDRGADSEIPSVDDIEADEADGVDGWVATPGGRLWYVDTQDMVVSQVCGIGCLRSDPNFRAGVQGKIRKSYTYQELLILEGN
ncbi:hypothetical protein BV394_04835 [Brevirhabdus pacifica]|uniref:Uncharacterized protein n=1 Tax=Brevirhabdus pacifica TaxID=1267768 RepID=A0A1U7DGV6_9RHOB|nr:DUF4329 domain-containing protein [Brevirhabdus pacifica]APX89123.1 hypothetical protein BV394_04835 [Brevirhabdus pacifica]OWU76817.1 hypothetical protein ATO5_11455 [Loktanella sp. 22II-4b]PJJ86286.1 uncharacterized protein DUF4329 [Brevirhabdus pacifica]